MSKKEAQRAQQAMAAMVGAAAAEDPSLFVPETSLLGPDGRPLPPEAWQPVGPVGIDLYEATGGGTSLEALAAITTLRSRRERSGTLVVAPGEISDALLIEVAVFNREAYQGRELAPHEREAVGKAEMRRKRRAEKMRRDTEREQAGKERALEKLRGK